MHIHLFNLKITIWVDLERGGTRTKNNFLFRQACQGDLAPAYVVGPHFLDGQVLTGATSQREHGGGSSQRDERTY